MTTSDPQPIDGAPAVLWHRSTGRLTPNDRTHTICNDYDEPIGIYLGEEPALWRSWLGDRHLYTFAAMTDTRRPNGARLYKTFSPEYQRYSPFYMSSKVVPDNGHRWNKGTELIPYGGTVRCIAFSYGSDAWTHATNGNAFLRPVIIQRHPSP